MTIYYQDDAVTLHHGDCLEILDWLEADVLVTDPPYGVGWSISTNRRAKSKAHDGIQNDADTTVRDAVLSLWGAVSPAVIFGSLRAAFPADLKQTLIWHKPVDAGVVGSTTGYRTDVELIFLTGEHIRRNSSRSSVLATHGGMSTYRSGHPHAKPVALLQTLMEWLPDGVIADPFAGSGSTLVAAARLGRKAIGVELEERYCEIAARRLSQGVLDFGEEPA